MPEPRRFVSMGASRAPGIAAKARDLEALRASVVDASGVSGAIWFSYLTALFYLLVSAGAVTHKDLFLENPVKLPFLNIDLPLKGFFLLGPTLFVILHAYVLLHFAMLVGKVTAFDEELRRQITDGDVRTDLRRQLPINVFVQVLAGPYDVRTGVVGALLKLVTWISLVFGPLALLMFFLLQFLPYQSESIAWCQRATILADLGLLWTLWPSLSRPDMQGVRRRRRPLVRVCRLALWRGGKRVRRGVEYVTAWRVSEWRLPRPRNVPMPWLTAICVWLLLEGVMHSSSVLPPA